MPTGQTPKEIPKFTLTTKKALAEYDIGRLANHIDELRKRGVSINRTRVNHHNGKGKHHYEFTLAKEQE